MYPNNNYSTNYHHIMGTASSSTTPEQVSQYRNMYHAQYGHYPPNNRGQSPGGTPQRQGTFVMEQRPGSRPNSAGRFPPPVPPRPSSSHSNNVSLPPIGFRPEVTNEPQVTPRQEVTTIMNPDHDQDCSRDITLTRVISADEFLGRMDDTDEQLRNLAEFNDEEMKPQMLEMLGLRGHLQDELLRIQNMLFVDDPELQCLNDFEGMCPQAVNKIRELTVKAKAIQAIASGTQTSENSQSNSRSRRGPARGQGSQTVSTNDSTTVNDTGIQLDMDVLGDIDTTLNLSPETGPEGEATSTDGSGSPSVDITEEDLKVKHDEEEQKVAHGYLRKIKDRQSQNPEELDKLLNDHLLSMQALRKRQELEKDKLNHHLDSMKRNRLLNRAQVSQGNIPKQSTARTSSKPKFVQGVSFWVDAKKNKATQDQAKAKSSGEGKKVGKKSTFWIDVGNSDKKGKSLATKAPPTRLDAILPTNLNKTESNSRPSSGSGLRSDGILEKKPIKPGSAGSNRSGPGSAERKSQDSGTYSMLGDRLSSDDSDNELQDIIASVNSRPSTASYSDDFEEDDDTSAEKDEMQGTLKKDLWSNRNKMTSEDFKEMIGKFRDQQDERDRIKNAERDKHKGSLLARLAESKRKKKQGDQDTDEEETPSALSAGQIGTQTDSGMSATMAADKDNKVTQAIKNKEEAFVETVLSRNRNMTDEEFEDMLKRHLVDVDAIRKRRRGEKDKLDDKLREKLQRRKGLKQGEFSDEDSEEDSSSEYEEEVQELEEEFHQELKRKRRSLTEEDLQALLERHRRDRAELERKKKSEKSRTDDRLRKKLAERKKKRMEAAEESQSDPEEDKQEVTTLDDQFFQDLQRQQQDGQLTEAMFADMLQGYMSQMDRVRKKEEKTEKRKQREEERQKEADSARQTASTLVQEHQEQAKQITNIRRRERQAMDERLQSKLRRKKQKQAAGVES